MVAPLVKQSKSSTTLKNMRLSNYVLWTKRENRSKNSSLHRY